MAGGRGGYAGNMTREQPKKERAIGHTALRERVRVHDKKWPACRMEGYIGGMERGIAVGVARGIAVDSEGYSSG